MSDDGASRRFPARLREGNGIAITYENGAYTISADLDDLTVTPAGAAAPVSLAAALAQLIAHDTGTAFVTTIDDGFYDVPGTGGAVSADDGFF